MAKKKPAPKKKAPKRANGEPRISAGLPESIGWANLPAVHDSADTPLQQAQVVFFQALDEPDPKKRVKLAKQALALSPDCADAYVLLSEQAKTAKEAVGLLEQAVAAGERAIGPAAFRDDVGHFWGLLETRPYMRAREGLAHALWGSGRRDDAVGHLQEMLRLNPNDNQGARYTLASWLADLDRDEELGQLLDRYDEGSTTWVYTRSLLAFRRGGDSRIHAHA